ncbi:hypothetical protein PS624_04979 [Pseudomonas fluorescens]|uniref:Uncharacterized protein n=1 Tax=Pseudomonas fluorescens TaxID=294 RepID=A0A5E7WCY0_PSEFL|nr:hypothetical protein PS624_04979 [Pseudomonas fluorescens]VVQ32325.1 hypothetical protein PS947_02815 [Pseudomonas fluorescens]
MHTGFQVQGHRHAVGYIFIADGVEAGTANQLIGAIAADQQIITCPTIQDIIARQTAYLIIARSTEQIIGTSGPVDYRHYIVLVFLCWKLRLKNQVEAS